MGAESSASPQGLLDRVAIAVSALCVIHCVATAVFVGLVASLGSVLGNPLVHEVGLAIAITLGAIALGRGTMQHRRVVPAAIGGLGLGIMAGALFLPHGMYEAAATIVGVSTLALGHHLNRAALA
ncbi:MerC domain-containing protein [Sphingomonas antarctica]|uniref:MerC domain-containing protein n=1 Tax=Sphingomonas antarctica TaxID=2040274 RepID=UPI0039EC3814